MLDRSRRSLVASEGLPRIPYRRNRETLLLALPGGSRVPDDPCDCTEEQGNQDDRGPAPPVPLIARYGRTLGRSAVRWQRPQPPAVGHTELRHPEPARACKVISSKTEALGTRL